MRQNLEGQIDPEEGAGPEEGIDLEERTGLAADPIAAEGVLAENAGEDLVDIAEERQAGNVAVVHYRVDSLDLEEDILAAGEGHRKDCLEAGRTTCFV